MYSRCGRCLDTDVYLIYIYIYVVILTLFHVSIE